MFSRGKRSGGPTTDSDATTADAAGGASCREDQRADVAVDLRVLGLSAGASWDDICRAHRRLVADLTPGPEAAHRNVPLANRLLTEVNRAFASLRAHSGMVGARAR